MRKKTETTLAEYERSCGGGSTHGGGGDVFCGRCLYSGHRGIRLNALIKARWSPTRAEALQHASRCCFFLPTADGRAIICFLVPFVPSCMRPDRSCTVRIFTVLRLIFFFTQVSWPFSAGFSYVRTRFVYTFLNVIHLWKKYIEKNGIIFYWLGSNGSFSHGRQEYNWIMYYMLAHWIKSNRNIRIDVKTVMYISDLYRENHTV